MPQYNDLADLIGKTREKEMAQQMAHVKAAFQSTQTLKGFRLRQLQDICRAWAVEGFDPGDNLTKQAILDLMAVEIRKGTFNRAPTRPLLAERAMWRGEIEDLKPDPDVLWGEPGAYEAFLETAAPPKAGGKRKDEAHV